MGILVALLSAFIVGAVLILSGEASFYTLPLMAAYLLFLMAFARRQTLVLPLLLGFTLTTELLGTQRAGVAAIFSSLLFLLTYLFQAKLSFTAPFTRYLLSLFVLLVCYNFLFFSLDGFWQRMGYLTIAFPCYCAIIYAWYVTRYTSTTHERS